MKKDKYSSEWIAEQDAKNAADALAHLRKAFKCLQVILSNAKDVGNAIECVDEAIREVAVYKPYEPTILKRSLK